MKTSHILCLLISLTCVMVQAQTFQTYESMEQGLFEASNKARTDPFYYKEIISDELNSKFTLNEADKFAICYQPSDFDSQGFKQCEASRETYEGRAAWMDAIVYLSERAQPQQGLKYSNGLSKACRDHVLDIGTSGTFSHLGTDSSTPEVRAARHIFSGDATVENLAFIDERSGLSAEPEQVIATMIINDGELDRDTRNNILNPDFTHMGIACGCHTKVGEVCCFAYGKDIDDGAQGPMNSLYDAPREQCNAQSSEGKQPQPSYPTGSQTSNPGYMGSPTGSSPYGSSPTGSNPYQQSPYSQYPQVGQTSQGGQVIGTAVIGPDGQYISRQGYPFDGSDYNPYNPYGSQTQSPYSNQQPGSNNVQYGSQTSQSPYGSTTTNPDGGFNSQGSSYQGGSQAGTSRNTPQDTGNSISVAGSGTGSNQVGSQTYDQQTSSQFNQDSNLGFTNDSPYKSLNSPEYGYDPLARKIAEELNDLRNNPDDWAESVDYNAEASFQAKSFQTDDIPLSWNQGLVNGARAYVNDAGPCDSTKTRNGQNLFNTIVPSYITHYGSLNGVVYKGKVMSAKDILVDLLARKQFNDDMKNKKFDEIGVGCACNPNEELLCVIVFGDELTEKYLDYDVEAMDHVDDRDQCSKKCNYY